MNCYTALGAVSPEDNYASLLKHQLGIAEQVIIKEKYF